MPCLPNHSRRWCAGPPDIAPTRWLIAESQTGQVAANLTISNIISSLR
jgi:hypothetical protein